MDALLSGENRNEAKNTEDSNKEHLSNIARTVEDIENVYKHGGHREDTLFYKLVLGGTVNIVEQVLQELTNREMTEELEWLLMLKSSPNVPYPTYKKVFMVIGAAVFSILWILLTPVFYIIHGILGGILMRLMGRISTEAHIKLPLAFAALSNNPEMIRVFYNFGVKLDCCDSNKNNVFHYIADLSLNKPEAAQCSYKLINLVYQQEELMHKLLLRDKNIHGLSALELTLKAGSFRFLNTLFETSDMMKTTSFRTRETNGKTNKRNYVELALYDISYYECGAVTGYRSFLFSLLSNRNMAHVEREDMLALRDMRLLQLWYKAKAKMLSPFLLILQIVDIAFTILFVYYLIGVGGDNNWAPLRHVYEHTMEEVLDEPLLNSSLDVSELDFLKKYHLVCTEKVVVNGYNLTNCEDTALKRLKHDCKGFDMESIIMNVVGVNTLDYTTILKLVYVFVILSVIYILLDVVQRLAIVIGNFRHPAATFSLACLCILGIKLPGSYITKQLNMGMSVGIIIYAIYFKRMTLQEDPEPYFADMEVMSYLVVVVICLRILTHIHSLRLLPEVGPFVVTTFAMASTLFKFLTVYSLVMIGFAMIFNLTQRNPECLAEKLDGFQSIQDSLLSTFKLLLGHDDFFYGTNGRVKIAYVVYCVISVFLLLNLIIAVMSTVATDVMNNPWRDTMWRMEIMKELLSTEGVVNVVVRLLFWPLYLRLYRWAGFLVSTHQRKGKYNLWKRKYKVQLHVYEFPDRDKLE